MLVTVLLFSVIIVLLIVEAISIKNDTVRLQYKIHVNGTRGKSTVTKYIYTALLNSNLKALGKITGEIPTLFLPDGSSQPIRRHGPARVQEQFKTIRKAKKLKANALIMECMSIDPMFQKLESKFFKPDIYIITNIRDDHREKMGIDLDSQIRSICSAIPQKSKVISIVSDYMEIIKKETIAKDSTFIEACSLNNLEINRLPQMLYKSNVELALTACTEIGIPRHEAFNSILNIISETESPVYQISDKQYFLNAFPVNDIESVDNFISYWGTHFNISGKRTIIFNTRSDRPLRTGVFANWIKTNQSIIDVIIITGNHKWKAKQLLVKMKLEAQLVYLKSKRKVKLKDDILNLAGDSEFIIGIGNIKGLGYSIINELSTAL